MSAPVRYRPAQILHWLEIGAGSLRTKADIGEEPPPNVKKAIFEALSRVLDFGKGTVADVTGRALRQLEYSLYEDRFEVIGAASHRTIAYREVKRIEATKRTGFRIVTGSGSLRIKPYAWLTVSGVRVPLGWERNGMEVPFELLIEELAARSRAPVEITNPAEE